jgi:VWFA-related protein
MPVVPHSSLGLEWVQAMQNVWVLPASGVKIVQRQIWDSSYTGLRVSRPLQFLAVLALLRLPIALAQNPPAPSASTPVFKTSSTLVLVPALVSTKAGEPVFTLPAHDFVLTDDGVPQKIRLEEDAGEQPLAVVIAVETGGAGAGFLQDYRDLDATLEAVVGGVPHQVAVVGIDSAPNLLLDFTSDMNRVGSTLQELQPGDSGAAILDGLGYAVDLLRQQPAEYRRAILLLSETVDHGSHTSLEDSLRAISDTNTAIYAFAFSSSKAAAKHQLSHAFADSEPGPAGGCMAKDPNADSSSSGNRWAQAWNCLSLLAPPLRALSVAAILGVNGMHPNTPKSVARLTGGEFFPFKNTRSLEHDLLIVSNHIPNRYVLSFHPQSPHPGLHILGVRLKEHPDFVVRARTSYWVDGAMASTP